MYSSVPVKKPQNKILFHRLYFTDFNTMENVPQIIINYHSFEILDATVLV